MRERGFTALHALPTVCRQAYYLPDTVTVRNGSHGVRALPISKYFAFLLASPQTLSNQGAPLISGLASTRTRRFMQEAAFNRHSTKVSNAVSVFTSISLKARLSSWTVDCADNNESKPCTLPLSQNTPHHRAFPSGFTCLLCGQASERSPVRVLLPMPPARRPPNDHPPCILLLLPFSATLAFLGFEPLAGL